MKKLSLRTRLTLIVSGALFIAWCMATSFTYFELRDSLRQIFDSQQLLFAKRLSVLNTHGMMGPMGQRRAEPELPDLKSRVFKQLEYDDDALAFAIFNRHGDMVLNDGENGKKFRFDPRIFDRGEPFAITENHKWRIVWLMSIDRRSIIAVGQELEYQQELLEDLMFEQMKPWLITFALLIIIIIVMIGREFASLKQLTGQISERSADDDTPIELKNTPKEVQPIIGALNALFLRISQTILHERQFTSDAAHELRTPLAALKVQTEVAQLSDDDPEARAHALNNLLKGIDRTTHLVDQLLTLSRLDSLSPNDNLEPVHLAELIQSVMEELAPFAEKKNIAIVFNENAKPVIQGNALLLGVLLRNVINNAIRYIPDASQITIELNSHSIIIDDNGLGVPEKSLHRLGERFFRPPGQKVDGSGLGLSIVKQIAVLHGFKISLQNKSQPDSGFIVKINLS